MSFLKNTSENVLDDNALVLQIGDFLGFCDMNSEEAFTSDSIEKLENYVYLCQERHKTGDSLVSDAVYDKLIEVLQRVNPNSELIGRIWDDVTDSPALDDTDALFTKNPMYSIQTIKSYTSQALVDFSNMLPKGDVDIHASLKENGWGIRLVYKDGQFVKARTRARASAGRDITPQLTKVLEKYNKLFIDGIKDLPLCEIRGELVVSFETFGKLAAQVSVRSPFSAVSMLVKESATEDDWRSLDFVAYKFIAEGIDFSTKSEEYEFIEDTLGLEVPMSWLNTINTKESDFIEELKGIMADCEDNAKDYQYYTDGVVIEVDSVNLARKLGQGNGNYNNYNLAMKVGQWQQDMYEGYVQTILWVKGKVKLSPVAIVAEDNDVAEFDEDVKPFIYDLKEITNIDDLGVLTAGGNKVKRVPLYEPRNMLTLNAWRGQKIHFRYGGEAGVVPCKEDGSPLLEGKIQEILVDEDSDPVDIEE